MKQKLIILLSISLLLGCGSGSSDNKTSSLNVEANPISDPHPEENLKLTVGNITIDSSTTLPRVSSIIQAELSRVETFTFNKEVEIELKGKDADKFAIQVNYLEYNLVFRESQIGGKFEVDIHASAYGQTVVYKVLYNIQESVVKQTLLGETLYYMSTEDKAKNIYKSYTFADETINIKDFDTQTDELKNEITTPILYATDYVKAKLFKEDIQKCTVSRITSQYNLHGKNMTFRCLYSETHRTYGDEYYLRFRKEKVGLNDINPYNY